MSFNSVGQCVANHKAWDHVGNIIPPVESSEGIRSGTELKPAAWLPVQFYDKSFEDWIVVTPGKIIATDNDGRLVPRQYGLAAATITYTADDVTAGTIDVRTGVALLTAAIGVFNVAAVSSFMGRGVEALAISKPIGVCPQAYIQWCGDAGDYDDGFNPWGLKRHNYNRQHLTPVLFDYVLELPWVPAATSSANLTRNGVATVVNNLYVQAFTALGNLPVATVSPNTPITFANGTLTNASTIFANQVADHDAMAAIGDWCINYQTGVIEAVVVSTLAPGNLYTISYSNYASAPTGTNVSKFACVLGDLHVGDFLKANADSNWIECVPHTFGDGVANNFDDFSDIMGQIVAFEVYPKDALDRVRTAYANLGTTGTGAYPGSAGQMDQMPGSATSGRSDKIHYAGAADMVAIVNLVSR